MFHCALTAESSAMIDTRRCILPDCMAFSSKCGGSILVGDVALARDGFVSETRERVVTSELSTRL